VVKYKSADYMYVERPNKLHSRGNPAQFCSIPAGTPQHYFLSLLDFRGFRGIPAVPIPVQVTTMEIVQSFVVYLRRTSACL